jgi:hypothetical protein
MTTPNIDDILKQIREANSPEDIAFINNYVTIRIAGVKTEEDFNKLYELENDLMKRNLLIPAYYSED